MTGKRKDETQWQQLGRYWSMAMLLPSALLVGYVIGYLLDKAFGTDFLNIVFLFLGIVAGLIQFVREATKDE